MLLIYDGATPHFKLAGNTCMNGKYLEWWKGQSTPIA